MKIMNGGRFVDAQVLITTLRFMKNPYAIDIVKYYIYLRGINDWLQVQKVTIQF